MTNNRDWNQTISKWITANTLIWVIYILLLGVLLPHTAWAFAKFEPTDSKVVAWGGAIAFEAAIAVFTHKLAKHIETTAKHKTAWRRFAARYLNAYGGGLLIAWIVSTLANLAHSVEFGQALKIFDSYGIPTPVYAIAFGAILPTTSLLFARILSNVIEHDSTEDLPNEAEQALRASERAARREVNDLRLQINTLRLELEQVKQQAASTERLFSDDKRVRILTTRELFPNATGAAIASLAGVAPSYVSEVLTSHTNGHGGKHNGQ